MRRALLAAAAVIVGAAATTVTIVVTTDEEPRRAVTTIGVSPAGNDTTCARGGGACKSFERAYQVAQPGDTIVPEAGTYPGGYIEPDATKAAGATITITPSCTTPNCVTVQGFFYLSGQNVRLVGNGNGRQLGSSNFLIYKLDIGTSARRAVATGLHLLTFFVTGSQDVTVRDSEVGPFLACYGRDQPRRTGDTAATVCPYDPPYYPYGGAQYANVGSVGNNVSEPKVGPSGELANSKPRNIVLDRLYFHDHNSSNIPDNQYGNSFHSGCLFLVSVDGLVLRNSIFRSCVVYDIQVQDFTTAACCGQQYGPPTNVTIENNWFGQPVNAASGQTGTSTENGCGVTFSCKTNTASDGQAAVQLGDRNQATAPPPFNTIFWQSWLVRFNSFQSGWSWDQTGDGSTGGFSNVRFLGNIGAPPSGACSGVAGLTYTLNAFYGTTCGTGALLTSSPFRTDTIPGLDLHLTGGAAAGLITATGGDYDLATDFDGETRTAPRDAGSDQRSGTVPPPPPPPTTTTGQATTAPPTTTVPPPPPSPLTKVRETFEQRFLPNLRAATIYKTWRTQNPGEAARFDEYLDHAQRRVQVTPPVMTTAFGRALVASVEMYALAG